MRAWPEAAHCLLRCLRLMWLTTLLQDLTTLSPTQKCALALYNQVRLDGQQQHWHLSSRQRPLTAAVLQILETVVGIGVINFVVRSPRAEASEQGAEEEDVFKLTFRFVHRAVS